MGAGHRRAQRFLSALEAAAVTLHPFQAGSHLDADEWVDDQTETEVHRLNLAPSDSKRPMTSSTYEDESEQGPAA